MALQSNLLMIVTLVIFFFLSFIAAHPGEHHDTIQVYKDMQKRGLEALNQKKELESCSGSEEAKARAVRAGERRAATVARLRKERGLEDVPMLHRRNMLHERTLAQFKSFEQISHDRTQTLKYNASTPHSTLFAANASCILTPDNADGPYYVLGEHIRTDVREGQPGVPMHLEMQFLDTTTCKGAQPLVVDIWSCNATGAYSGVSAAGEGGLDTTFLRGVQQTDVDGVVNFDTIFPGHYQGRATHEHIITHSGATILPNGTFQGGHVSHLSQLFFAPALLNAVEATAPYNTNKIPKTTNDADGFTGYAANAAYDPFPNYVMLGSKLSDGLFMWIELGIKPSNDVTSYASNAAFLQADGGHNNPNFNQYNVITPPSTHG
ncbi:hypothetical protein LSUE1_G006194 [Lachnellula suecica]|uniref:Intradiol ring-cleavage dioxygenases domain-containing protein n=1 Tax=Lachnellula suecica TaxID=602035 RepID=A0A8T9BXP6_9HELO|nr:hypothetical protein LSUE1_G006194 [Lachnellula suecica]